VDSDAYVGKYTSIALDTNGLPHISYYDDTNKDLKYAKLMPINPTPARTLQATPSNRYVNLSWNPPSSNGGSPITAYKIYRATTPGGETLLKIVGNVLNYTDSDVTNNQSYYYQISAVNSVGEGEKSKAVVARPTMPMSTTPMPTMPMPTPTTSAPTSAPPTQSTTPPIPTVTPTPDRDWTIAIMVALIAAVVAIIAALITSRKKK
jgi:hypothetical protein